MNSRLSNIEELENSSIVMLYSYQKINSWIFFIIFFMVAAAFVALPLVQVDVSVRSRGVVRPLIERTEIKSDISGTIDSVFYREGDLVQKGSVILRLKDEITASKYLLNQQEMDRCRQMMHDLQLLTSHERIDPSFIRQLTSPVYKAQSLRFFYHDAEQEALLKKANKEEKMSRYLFDEKVISSKEFFDTRVQHDKTNASYKAFISGQQSEWQQDLIKYKLMLAEFEAQKGQIEINAEHYKIRSPLTGTIQQIHAHYAGDWLQANDAICFVSPEGDLMAECYVLSRDIGFIKKDQPVYFQIDAFDYNYFGSIKGKVFAVDNDYTLIDQKPFFKIRCSFDSSQMHTRKELNVQIKKGLSFQARFIINRRSVWQLLFDRVDDWLNPSAP
ncbi:MAG: HlyD family efflux transporter periplasmic adaptor subunit [Bacteroidetes bacterium]|nr:HlyD family efflux transporter periplasmic adaptor subunit [Bacteroidota bacterium]